MMGEGQSATPGSQHRAHNLLQVGKHVAVGEVLVDLLSLWHLDRCVIYQGTLILCRVCFYCLFHSPEICCVLAKDSLPHDG